MRLARDRPAASLSVRFPSGRWRRNRRGGRQISIGLREVGLDVLSSWFPFGFWLLAVSRLVGKLPEWPGGPGGFVFACKQAPTGDVSRGLTYGLAEFFRFLAQG